MTNTVSRRGVLVGGAAVSAASCASMPVIPGGQSSVSIPISIPEYVESIQQNARLTELGLAVASHFLHSAHGKVQRREVPINGRYTIPGDATVAAAPYGCCADSDVVIEDLIIQYNARGGRGGGPWRPNCNIC